MKRQLTFSSLRIIFTPLRMTIILFFTVITAVSAFFPESPAQLTLLTKNDQYYQALCPTLFKASTVSDNKKVPLPFHLLNWNIYKQQKENWNDSLKKWANNADFITLQEAKLSPKLIQLSHERNFFYLQNYAFKHNNLIYGVNTLSKVAPLSLCGSASPEPWILIPKTGLASTYPLQGSTDSLLLINLHGVNFTFTEKPLVKQLKPYLALIKRHQGPIIFSGDFNTWSDARLNTVEESLIDAGFSEALFNDDKRLTAFGLPLDHIYFRGLKVIKAESLATDASDHSPQFVTFDLAE